MTETEKDLPQDDAAAAFRQKEEFLAIMSHEILTPMNELVSKVSLLFDSPLILGSERMRRPYRDARKISWPSTTTCTSSWLVGDKTIGREVVNDDGNPIGADRKKYMTRDANNQNLRVLVIDDNPSIHEDFRKILQAKAGEESFDQARAALFGDPPLSRGV